MLNFYNLNYPSCKIPFLSSNTFHLSPPSHSQFQHLYAAQLLSYHAQGLTEAWLKPKVLNRGTTWQTRTAVCLAVFFQAFVHRMIKKEPGVHLLLCSRGDIYEGLLNYIEINYRDHSRYEPDRQQDGKDS